MPVSTSETSQRTQNIDSSQSASGQGVNYRERGRKQGNTRIGRGATVTINQGVDPAVLRDLLGRSGSDGPGSGAPGNVTDAVTDRIVGTVEAGGEAAEDEARGKLGLGNWALIIGGSVALLIAIWIKTRRKG